MALVPIYRQPIMMAPIPEMDYAECDAPSEFCSLFKTGDPMTVQMEQTPCGDNLMCNPDFDLTDNLVTNGTFTGSAAGWTLGTGWTYGSNKVTHAGASGTLTQTIASLVNGKTYFISIVISGVGASGQITLQTGGGTTTIPIVADGTYTFVHIAGATTTLTITGLNTISVDDVSVRTTDCWNGGTSWTFGNGVACHTPGSAGSLYAVVYTGIPANSYIVATYEIFGMSAGSLQVDIGGDTTRTVTENGTYSDYIQSGMTSDDIIFTADSDFDGCLSVTTTYLLRSQAQLASDATVIDTNGNYVRALPVTLNQDRVNIAIGSDMLGEGCYRFAIVDDCADIDEGTEINDDVPFDDAGDWTFDLSLSDGGTAAVSGGEMTFEVGAGFAVNPDIFLAMQNHVFPDGDTAYLITIEVQAAGVSGTGTGDQAGGKNIGIVYPTNNGASYATLFIATDIGISQTYSLSAIINVSNGTSGAYHNKWGIYFSITNTYATGDIIHFASYSAKFMTPVAQTGVYISNCLMVRDDTGNAQYVHGISDQARALGFLFDPTYFPRLGSRLYLSFTNPHDPVNQGNYLYSSGQKKKTFAQISEMFDLIFEAVDQNMHRTIAAMLSSDHFRIGANIVNYNEYVWEEKTYNPKWAKKSPTGTAESEVEIGRITGTEFN